MGWYWRPTYRLLLRASLTALFTIPQGQKCWTLHVFFVDFCVHIWVMYVYGIFIVLAFRQSPLVCAVWILCIKVWMFVGENPHDWPWDFFFSIISEKERNVAVHIIKREIEANLEKLPPKNCPPPPPFLKNRKVHGP